jgi:hypothetical protein
MNGSGRRILETTATNPDKIKSSSEALEHSDVVPLYATYLLFAELGLGALLHAVRFPFTGYLLSLNQIFLLTRALWIIDKKNRFLPGSISTLAALLKSIAPMGKKITPMLAIAMQGYLYNLGILFFGNTSLGRILGGALSSLWGFAQPLILYYFIFGSSFYESLFNSVGYLEKALGISFSAFVIAAVFIVLFKVSLAIALVILAPFVPQAAFEKYITQLSKTIKTNDPSTKPLSLREISRKALFDLLNPFFLLSIMITAIFLYYSQDFPGWILNGILRPLALGFICFFVLRWITGEKLLFFFGTAKKSWFNEDLNKIMENLRK